MRIGFVIAIVVASLVGAPSVAAYEFPGQQPAPPAIGDLVGRASDWWHGRGVNSADCDGQTIVAWSAPALRIGDIDAAGGGSHCEVWVTEWVAEEAVFPTEVAVALDACFVVAHEVGHAFGLGHDYPGIMGGSGKRRLEFQWTPAFCWRWAQNETAATLRGMGSSERQIKRSVAAQTRRARRLRA